MNKLYLFVFALVFSITSSISQEPEKELRGVWLTSVYNIDWPHSTNVSALNQQNRLREILDVLKDGNINAVFFQVRPNADALYQSSYEPWSHWITGQRGNEPSYDPLAFVIQEANKRGIEVHAWLNPYRFENIAGQYAGLPGDYSQTHPELIMTHDSRTYFDPGIPATTELITNIVADLITSYDLDGVIFDDYFYPSGMPNSLDQETYDTYATQEFVGQWYSQLTRGNFRRASVNNMIREVNNTIKYFKPSMAFGVSPAGIYSTQPSAAIQWGTTLPEGITGRDNYNVIFCDPLAWLHDGSVDYISPQLYWVIGGPQDFITLTEWWGAEATRFGLHHYPSLASYRIYPQKSLPDDKKIITNGFESLIFDPAQKEGYQKFNWNPSEIANQIIAHRNSEHNLALGFIFYNTRSYVSPTKDLAGYLANGVYSEKSIFPHIPWLQSTQFGSPQITEIGVVGGMEDDLAAMTVSGSQASRFLVYGYEELPTKETHSEGEFLQVIFGKDFSLFYPEGWGYFTVEEFMHNRETGNMSQPVSYEYLVPANIISPDNEEVCDDFLFDWADVAESEHYQLTIARQQSPGTIVYSSPLLTGSSYVLGGGILEGQVNYVFRIKSTAGQSVSWSEQGSFFTGTPASTKINTPAHGATNVNLTSTFQWNSSAEADFYHIQIATDASFDEQSLVIDHQPVNLNLFSVTLEAGNQQHFARVRPVNSCGYGLWSEVNSFTTAQGTSVNESDLAILLAFPNPAGESCQIVYPSALGQRTIELSDANGRIVDRYERSDRSTREEINLSALVPGFYIIQVKTADGQRFISKIVKTR